MHRRKHSRTYAEFNIGCVLEAEGLFRRAKDPAGSLPSRLTGQMYVKCPQLKQPLRSGMGSPQLLGPIGIHPRAGVGLHLLRGR